MHIATDSDHPGKLAVQYWFYYTFNDFTNKHEGDWEMAQVNFDAATPEQALKTGPDQVDYAQHSGGERGAWHNDPKLTTDGTHPLEYVATGAHAGFFQRKLYLGKGGTAVFGCEDTRSATDLFTLHTVVVPDTPVPRDSPFAWLNFQGRWGQRQPSVNNGPLGPANADREVWTHPITWSEGLRTSSLAVRGGHALGLSVTESFLLRRCGTCLGCAHLGPDPSGAVLRRARPARSARSGDSVADHVEATRPTADPALTWWRTDPTSSAAFVSGEPVDVHRHRRGLHPGRRRRERTVQWVLFHLTGLSGVIILDGRRGAVTALLALLIGDIGGAFAAAAVTGAVVRARSVHFETGRPTYAASRVRPRRPKRPGVG